MRACVKYNIKENSDLRINYLFAIITELATEKVYFKKGWCLISQALEYVPAFISTLEKQFSAVRAVIIAVRPPLGNRINQATTLKDKRRPNHIFIYI